VAAPVTAPPQSPDITLLIALCRDDYYEDTAGRCTAISAGEVLMLEAVLEKYGACRAAICSGSISSIIIGGTFGAAVAQHLWFRATGRSERILVLEAGPFPLTGHTQNFPSFCLGREVCGVPWQYDPVLAYHPNAGLAYCIGDSLYLGRTVTATARQRDHRQMASQRTRRTQRQHAAERG
jgi:hypothetical protein